MHEAYGKARIVCFVFDGPSAQEVMRRRTDSGSIGRRLQITPPAWPEGAQAHIGNSVEPGDICPAMVVRVWDSKTGSVNLQVLLDGSDTYWATSVPYDEQKGPRSWHWIAGG